MVAIKIVDKVSHWGHLSPFRFIPPIALDSLAAAAKPWRLRTAMVIIKMIDKVSHWGHHFSSPSCLFESLARYRSP